MSPDRSPSKSILVIVGGTGFIGSALTRAAHNEGFKGVSLCRRGSHEIDQKNPSKMPFAAIPHFDLLDDNLTWIPPLGAWIQSKYPNREVVIINCAGVFTNRPLISNGEGFGHNEIMTRHLIEACKQLNAQSFIHLSSSTLYASQENKTGIYEHEVVSEHELINDYARSKWQCEQIIEQAITAIPHLRVTILRPQLVYGPGEKLFLPPLLRLASSIGLPQTTPLGPLIDITSVAHLIQAIFCSIRYQNRSSPAIFNISDGTPIYLLSELKKICFFLNIPFRTFSISKKNLFLLCHAQKHLFAFQKALFPFLRKDISHFGPLQAALLSTDRTLDITRAVSLLHYHPSRHTREGLHHFATALRAQGRKKAS